MMISYWKIINILHFFLSILVVANSIGMKKEVNVSFLYKKSAGPDLWYKKKQMKNSILDKNKFQKSPYVKWNVILESKTKIQGKYEEIQTQNLLLVLSFFVYLLKE